MLASNTGFTASYDNDFDTAEYGEWVQGQTEITLNYNFLDLTTDVVSDTAKNVTEFRVVYDSRVHNDQLTDVCHPKDLRTKKYHRLVWCVFLLI